MVRNAGNPPNVVQPEDQDPVCDDGRRIAAWRRAQNASALMTSPELIVLTPIQIAGLMVFLTNRTEPSPNATLIPPECRLRAPAKASLSLAFGKQGSRCAGSEVQ